MRVITLVLRIAAGLVLARVSTMHDDPNAMFPFCSPHSTGFFSRRAFLCLDIVTISVHLFAVDDADDKYCVYACRSCNEYLVTVVSQLDRLVSLLDIWL